MPTYGMRRRDFVAALGGAILWPVLARAQQPAVPMVGCLVNGSQQDTGFSVAPFQKGLGELGLRSRECFHRIPMGGHNERLPALAASSSASSP